MADPGWREAYQRHLESEKWKSLRRRVWDRCGGVCEGCAERTAVELHHLTYARLGHELLTDLVALCEGCHDRAHRWTVFQGNSFELSREAKTHHVDRRPPR